LIFRKQLGTTMEYRDFTGFLSKKELFDSKSKKYDHDYRDLQKRPDGPEFECLLKIYYGPDLEKYAADFWSAILTNQSVQKIKIIIQLNADKDGLLDSSGSILRNLWITLYKCIIGLLTISPKLHHLEILLHKDMYYLNEKGRGNYVPCNTKILGRDICTWDLFNSILMTSIGCDWNNTSIVPTDTIIWMSSKLIGIRTLIIPWIAIYGMRVPSLAKFCALSRTLRFLFPLAEKIDVGWSRYIPPSIVIALFEEKYARNVNKFIQ